MEKEEKKSCSNCTWLNENLTCHHPEKIGETNYIRAIEGCLQNGHAWWEHCRDYKK